MQVLESAIVISLIDKPHAKTFFPPRSALLFLTLFFLLWIGEGLWLATGASRFPDIQQNFYHEMIIGGLVFAGILTLYGAFAFRKRDKRTTPPYVRIDQEGIFTSRDSFLFKWAEIKELSLTTYMGSPFLRIVPWNLAEVASRAKRSSGPFLRFGINLTLLLFGRSKSPPIGLGQVALPIPIDEMLTAIQERFASELREHHIMVRRSQS